MECFNGRTLKKAISSFYDDIRFKQLFKEICDSICVLHNEKIVHQDLNPGNILVDVVTGEHRIYDFGMSLCFSDKKEQLCLGMNDKVTWPFERGHSVYLQMAPWRTKDCAPADGCSYHDLKMGDYWAAIHYFLEYYTGKAEFATKFKPYKNGTDSVLFTNDFPQLYLDFTGDVFPDHLLKDITP
jgi:serine/threonine protein kinase